MDDDALRIAGGLFSNINCENTKSPRLPDLRYFIKAESFSADVTNTDINRFEKDINKMSIDNFSKDYEKKKKVQLGGKIQEIKIQRIYLDAHAGYLYGLQCRQFKDFVLPNNLSTIAHVPFGWHYL
ncbi:hypothetical protein TNIN_58581 [Trichonephila inaurata madagascariensis]|uniref:Uncharacterized protein n=1 Tax=Trichonephila inaurata madagascariensis TaxID=2747483 RepID=A0A8X6XH19_9ARAC|nr:hypothetical protein TNIN_58581 [Trichonephila inaurata madagascariensis]